MIPMKRMLASAVIGLSLGLIGCSDKAKVEETTTAEGPGGTTEVTKQTERSSRAARIPRP
jgi:hypothetical protein